MCRACSQAARLSSGRPNIMFNDVTIATLVSSIRTSFTGSASHRPAIPRTCFKQGPGLCITRESHPMNGNVPAKAGLSIQMFVICSATLGRAG